MSVWYRLGLWVGAWRWARGRDVSARELLQTTLATAIVAEVADNIREATERALSSVRRRPGPPPVTPAKAAELAMPTRAPPRRSHRPAPWPPFTGTRVALGDGPV